MSRSITKDYPMIAKRQVDHDVDLVNQFQLKFLVPNGKEAPLLPSREYLEFRLKRMYSELDEFSEAAVDRDLLGVYDALLDLVYLALGSALACGGGVKLWKQMFELVHLANMAKVRVARAEASKFGSRFDVVKPDGWRPPDDDQRLLLVNAGWRGEEADRGNA